MTGYAVTFNKRHKRSGHLFQNRYKSIVCEEDQYLLELIRYIHLNPLRSGLVKDLKELDKYPWTGHSAILSRRKNSLIPVLEKEVTSADKRIAFSQFCPETEKATINPENPVDPVKNKPLAEKTIEDVLLQFGDTLKVARRRYRHFVKQGVDQGTRPELQGGGLVRSAGGDKRALLRRKREERELSDERILGSGDFVNEILMKAGEKWEKGKEKRIPLAQLIEKVASHLDLKEESIFSTSRRREISEARSIVSYLAINEMGYSASEVGRALSINRENASRGAARGKKALDKYEDLKDIGN